MFLSGSYNSASDRTAAILRNNHNDANVDWLAFSIRVALALLAFVASVIVYSIWA